MSFLIQILLPEKKKDFQINILEIRAQKSPQLQQFLW